MKVKELIKVLQEYNLNAEVMVMTNKEQGDIGPASIIGEIDERPRVFGFAPTSIPEKMTKKKIKKVVIA